MNPALRNKLIAVATSLAIAGVGTYVANQPSPAVVLAMELGAHFESSGRHIGKPYIDKIGRGQPWTVCNGITGSEVDPKRYYTPEDCHRLELPRYLAAERAAKRIFVHWDTYNVWVQASIIDMIFNVGEGAVAGSTLVKLANAGDLAGACQQMPRWVYGTVAGKRTKLPGLEDRRDTTRELCAEWGKDGHFSIGLVARAAP